jgi:phosphoribosylformimino-5-aminoimidazole carboxamide ribotide isomerase
VADLDAITGGQPDVASWQQIAAAGMRLCLDAGIGNADAAAWIKEQTVRHGIDAQLIVGLESLESEQKLRAIVETCGDLRPIFSLDLKDGKPLVCNQEWRDASPVELSLLAQSAGIQELIVLDLADVGTGGGTRTLDLCRTIRVATRFRRIIAGGGVRGLDDLRALASAGCDAALVASALHVGLLTPEEVRQARSLSC